MNRLRGTSGYRVTIKDGDLVALRPDGSDLSQNVHFFYGCGLPEQEIKDHAGIARKKPLYKFLRFFGREEMEKYGVLF